MKLARTANLDVELLVTVEAEEFVARRPGFKLFANSKELPCRLSEQWNYVPGEDDWAAFVQRVQSYISDTQ